MPSVLQQIAEKVQARVQERKKLRPESELEKLCQTARPPQDFKKVFTASDVWVIAEVKFASPSQGKIGEYRRPEPVQVAADYLKAGAAALSVLTEQDYFNGKPEYLQAIREAFPAARLLMKDFMLERYQLLEAKVLGADAALLIVALLGQDKTRELLGVCRELGLSALVEVHDEEELRIAANVGAKLIGINNRNLKTLEISLETSRRLKPLAPPDATLISESGISSGSEIRELRRLGFSGFLVGTSFMKTGNPGQALATLIEEAR